MTCQIDGCTNPAPFGYRRPGLWSEQKKKSYLFVCADHREEAERRWKEAQR